MCYASVRRRKKLGVGEQMLTALIGCGGVTLWAKSMCDDEDREEAVSRSSSPLSQSRPIATPGGGNLRHAISGVGARHCHCDSCCCYHP